MTGTAMLGQMPGLLQRLGGQAGQQAWTALTALARRLQRRQAAGTGTAAPAGARDPGGASRLAAILARRAAADPGFAAALGQWLTGIRALLTAGPTTLKQVTGAVPGTAGAVSGGIRLGAPPDPAA